jgi:hypothetical protein
MTYQTRYELVNTIYKDALQALVVAVTGQKLLCEPFSPPIKEAADNLVEAIKAAQAVHKDDGWLLDEKAGNAITALVDALVGHNVPRGPYSKHVYKTAMKVMYAYRAGQEVQNCRITDLEEYKAEVERLRKIGLTIDPAIAETMFWYADVGDPYDILDPEKYHEDCCGRVQAARNPGGEWIVFHDLPGATEKALRKRDGHKRVFPYGVGFDHDIVNKPPVAEHDAPLGVPGN